MQELYQFQSFINNFHPTIKFTLQSSPLALPFLDISLRLEDGFIETDLHTKPTDAHAYLHYPLYHPGHCRRNIPGGQFLRSRCVCSDLGRRTLRSAARKQQRAHFSKCGYPTATITTVRERASKTPCAETLQFKVQG